MAAVKISLNDVSDKKKKNRVLDPLMHWFAVEGGVSSDERAMQLPKWRPCPKRKTHGRQI